LELLEFGDDALRSRDERCGGYLAKLGKKGGKKGGPARAAAMTPEQRSESARKAVMARWAKKEKS
jgi:hypothetical protein